MTKLNCTPRQMMAVTMARQIKDGDVVIVGTGLPLVAASLAKNSHAPNTVLLFESGVFDGTPVEVPTSVGDLRVCCKASALAEQFRYFGFQNTAYRKNKINLGFLGGAEIDPYGNLNSTCIGDYMDPKVRFTGSGGANGIATNCDTVIMMSHQKRRFQEKLHYVTSPGWVDGPGGRERAGLPGNKGPRAIITDMCVMRFDENTKRVYLAEYFPGLSPQEVSDNTAFHMDISRAVESEQASADILDILLNKVDPQRIMV